MRHYPFHDGYAPVITSKADRARDLAAERAAAERSPEWRRRAIEQRDRYGYFAVRDLTGAIR